MSLADIDTQLRKADIIPNTEMIDGVPIKVRMVMCSACGASEQVRYKPHAPPGKVVQQFEAKGWVGLGRRPLCPTCSRAKPLKASAEKVFDGKTALTKKWLGTRVFDAQKDKSIDETTKKPLDAVNVIEQANDMSKAQATTNSKVTLLREPTIAETIRIAGLLDLHFIDGRYKDGWSDERVSQELNLPRAMITKVREESPDHGPIKGDPELDALKSDLASARQMLAEFEARVAKLEKRFHGG